MVIAQQPVVLDIKVKNLARALIFYRDILGLKQVSVSTSWASLRTRTLEIHLNKHWGATAGLEFRVANIAVIARKLKDRGVKFTTRIETHSWGKIAHFKDSEGNTLALIKENPRIR